MSALVPVAEDVVGEITHVAADYRHRLSITEIGALQRFNSSYTGIITRLTDDLSGLEKQITARIASGESVPVSWLHRQQRYQSLLLQADREFSRYGGQTLNDIGILQSRAIELAQRSSASMLEAALPSNMLSGTFNRLPSAALEQIQGALDDGSPLSDLTRSFGDDAADMIETELTTGLAKGIHPTMITKNILARLDMMPVRAATLARTEMFRAYREANRSVYKANDNVVDAWIWFSHLGQNTCAACLGMHGSEHSLDEPMGSHPNCRCTMLPKTKSWADLGIAGVDDVRWDVGNAERFLANASPELQKRAFGNIGLWKEWKNGEIRLADTIRKVSSTRWGTNRTIGSRANALENARLRRIREVDAFEAERLQSELDALLVGKAQWVQDAQRIIARKASASEAEIRELGALVRRQIDNRVVINNDKLDEMSLKYLRLENELKTLRDDLQRAEAEFFAGRTPDALDDIRAMRQRMYDTDREYRDLQRRIQNFGTRAYQETTLEVLRELDPDYGTGRLAVQWFRGSKPAAKASLEEAVSYLPRQWVDDFNASGKQIRSTLVERAHFNSHYKGDTGVLEVLTSTNEHSRLGTSIHELSHFREYQSANLKRLEAEFYARRTAGEPLYWMGQGYRRDEVTRKDQFLHSYMGKDYNGRYYELASMGVESTFSPFPHVKIRDDEDFRDFILGLLAAAV